MRRQGLGCGCIYVGMGLANALVALILFISVVYSALSTDDTTAQASSAVTTGSGILLTLFLVADAVLILFVGAPVLKDAVQERGLVQSNKGNEDEEDEESDEGDEGEVDDVEESDEAKETEEG